MRQDAKRKMTDINPTGSIMTLNVNGLNNPKTDIVRIY